jgi:hypothetical protein
LVSEDLFNCLKLKTDQASGLRSCLVVDYCADKTSQSEMKP